MKTVLAMIFGVLFGGVTTALYLYFQLYIPWNESNLRAEEVELKLLSTHIRSLKEGRSQEVIESLESEVIAKQFTIDTLKNSQ